jgi:hypothetical protein
MTTPLDPEVRDLRELIAEAVKILEDHPAVDRFKVSTALGQVVNSTDPGIVKWATGWLRELQREIPSGTVRA